MLFYSMNSIVTFGLVCFEDDVRDWEIRVDWFDDGVHLLIDSPHWSMYSKKSYNDSYSLSDLTAYVVNTLKRFNDDEAIKALESLFDIDYIVF